MRTLICLFAISFTITMASAWAFLRKPGDELVSPAVAFVKLLSPEQRTVALLPYTDERRVDWHFIPKAQRKGLQYKEMSAEQRQASRDLLRVLTSETGYEKATTIMLLEQILRDIESKKGTMANIRDPERYYLTLFGEPGKDKTWGISIEGHHLSLNFTVENGRVTATTPTFFGANPAEVKTTFVGGPATGTRALADEEKLAFELVNSLDDKQKQAAVTAETAPKDIRDAGKAQFGPFEPQGVGFADLNQAQQQKLQALVKVYADNLPFLVAQERLARIQTGGWENVRFNWQGALKPGVGHHYVISGPTFIIELNNTQPDAEGNMANHIHSIWRDLRGDFGLERKVEVGGME
ncbi:MAG: DUF3500 domain-containing protein [Pirellulales bacterium]|nr:DUF3500 domain-containing protein [Pirellulales bacterium]